MVFFTKYQTPKINIKSILLCPYSDVEGYDTLENRK